MHKGMEEVLFGLARRLDRVVRRSVEVERWMVLQGTIAATALVQRRRLSSLADAEFSVFSQWGEDGILEWLVQRLGEDLPTSFVEFGVEDYLESNTRFLLLHRNWRGLVLDGDGENVRRIRSHPGFWRHDLTAVSAFITRENIDALLQRHGFSGELGVLSIDIDGNDYWVWESIASVRPWIAVVEYNAVFGDLHPLTIPYDAEFRRTRAHSSNLYFGASLPALVALAERKGYVFVGTNRAGGNAFFVRSDMSERVLGKLGRVVAFPSRFRESRDASGKLTFLRGAERSMPIGHLPVVNVVNGATTSLAAVGPLYGPEWLAAFAGGASRGTEP